MNIIQKRVLMFILCILTRISIVIISKYIDNKYLPVWLYTPLYWYWVFIYMDYWNTTNWVRSWW